MQVTVADLAEKGGGLALHAVGQVGGASLHAGDADLGGHVDEDREVRQHAADGETVDLRDEVGREIAGDALVDSGGVEITVGHDDGTAGEGRGNDFAHHLRARGGVEEKFRLGAHLVAAGIVDDNVANLFARRSAARFAGGDDFAAGLPEMLEETGDLRGLAAALGAFEGDEFSGVRGRGSHGAVGDGLNE